MIRLANDIIAGNLTGNYLTLVNDFIQPMLIHFSMAEYLPFASYTIANGGVIRVKFLTALPLVKKR